MEYGVHDHRKNIYVTVEKTNKKKYGRKTYVTDSLMKKMARESK